MTDQANEAEPQDQPESQEATPAHEQSDAHTHDDVSPLAITAIVLAAWPVGLFVLWYFPKLMNQLGLLGLAGLGIAPFSLITALIISVIALRRKSRPKGMAVFALVLVVAMGLWQVHLFTEYVDATKTVICRVNVNYIHTAVYGYHKEKDIYPQTIEHLSEGGPKRYYQSLFTCPIEGNDETIDFFYLPPAENDPENTILLCDYLANHNGRDRNILYVSGEAELVKEDEFQKLLTQPQNAAFATALGKAEANRDNNR